MLLEVHRWLARHCVALAVIGTTSIIAAGCSNGSQEVEAKSREIRQLRSAGMDIDEAIELLRAEGYRVGDKHHPTEAKDYYVALVPLRDHIPASDTVRYTVGMDGSSKAYVVIKSNKDGEIISVE